MRYYILTIGGVWFLFSLVFTRFHSFSLVFTLALCKAASDADDWNEEMFRKLKEKEEASAFNEKWDLESDSGWLHRN